MPEEFHVLVKKFDKIDTRSTGHLLLELRFVDIIIQLTNLIEEAINSSFGFLVIFLNPGHESWPGQSNEGFIHDLMESNTTIIPAPIYRTPATEASAITPDSTHRSLKPASC